MAITQYIQDPTFWVAFVTVIFAALVYKPIKNYISALLDARIDEIKNELEEASKLKDEANALLAEAEKRLAKSEEEAQEIISHAKTESESIISNAKDKLAQDIENRKKVALQKIQSFEDNAVSDIKKNISGLVVMSAQTILEENIDEEGFQNLIDDSLEKVSKIVH